MAITLNPPPLNSAQVDSNGNLNIEWAQWYRTLYANVTGSTLDVGLGGTGRSTLDAYEPIIGGTTNINPVQSVNLGNAGDLLQSNGAGAAPTFETIAGVANTSNQSEMEAETVTTKWVNPAIVKYNPGVAKAWVHFNGASGISILASQNISGVVRNSTGNYTISFTTSFSSSNYAFVGRASNAANQALDFRDTVSQTASSVQIRIFDTGANVVRDGDNISVVFFGDL